MINFPEQEKKILEFWEQDRTFQKTLDKDSPRGDYVFYDGPPFATGTPHYGHIVASIMKDVVPRFQTMCGYHVERKWGWDCHGLPVENIVEEELALKSKLDIEKLGVAKFNEACRGSVLRYADEWRRFIPRIGRWVDMDNDYKTMDREYMESIWWVFKRLYDQGLIYEGYKSMHVCPRCQTTLSNFEVSQNYKDIKDLSVIVKFELEDEPGTYLLAWTTTPWTLPGNVALALSVSIEYVKIKSGEDYFILAKTNLEQMMHSREYEVIDSVDTKILVGKKYRPLFDYYKDRDLENKDNLYTIQSADFVTAEDGTGIVHIAPAFGEDDLNLGQDKKLPFIQHVDIAGRFKDEVRDWPGELVKAKDDHQAMDKKVIKNLTERGLLFAQEEYEHSYPHCWRCDTPLLNYATSSWFVRVTDLKDKMIKNNQQVNWQPEHIKEGRFGKWLEGARDWAISRQRYWGSGLPIWKNDQTGAVMCVGSLAELEELSGRKIEDLHRPMIDEITWEGDGGTWQRIPDVLDCWFESGSMPYAQVHYPFANKEKFEQTFPAKFIAEGQDQTRGWFYTLMVLATALFDKPAFENVIVNGIVLAEDGNKMSKRLKNYPDPTELIDKYGADSLRYYLLTSPVMKATDLRFSEKDVAEVYRSLVMIVLNIVSFYKMYGDNGTDADSESVLDEWLKIRTQQLVGEVTTNLQEYKLVEAARPIMDYVNDFSTWYIRRSRDRFKNGSQAARRTTDWCLETLAKVMAPFLPFLAEWIWQEIGRGDSVHLAVWPESVSLTPAQETSLLKMAEVRKIVEKAHAARDAAGIKVRQPLNKLKCQLTAVKSGENDYLDLIKAEVNVKVVELAEKVESEVELDTEITSELEAEGRLRELVRQINSLRKQANLTIADRIKIFWESDSGEVAEVFIKFADELKAQVLADEVASGAPAGLISAAVEINQQPVKITLAKV